MKKQFLLILFTIFSCNLFAQSNSVGVFGGINVSNVKNDNYFKDSKSLTKFVFGVKYQREFSKPFIVEGGIVLNNVGGRMKIDVKDENNNHIGVCYDSWVYKYISVPVLFGYKFGSTISIIPKIGFQMSSLYESTINGSFDGIEHNEKMDLKYFNRFDFAGVIEAELGYNFYNNWDVFICLSGKYSFTNTAKFINVYKDTTIHHYSFSTTCGVKYSF